MLLQCTPNPIIMNKTRRIEGLHEEVGGLLECSRGFRRKKTEGVRTVADVSNGRWDR